MDYQISLKNKGFNRFLQRSQNPFKLTLTCFCSFSKLSRFPFLCRPRFSKVGFRINETFSFEKTTLPSWASSWELLGSSWANLRRLGGVLRPTWGVLGRLGALLGVEKAATKIRHPAIYRNLGLHGNGKRESLEKLQKQVKVNLKGFCECCKNQLKLLFFNDFW